MARDFIILKLINSVIEPDDSKDFYLRIIYVTVTSSLHFENSNALDVKKINKEKIILSFSSGFKYETKNDLQLVSIH